MIDIGNYINSAFDYLQFGVRRTMMISIVSSILLVLLNYILPSLIYVSIIIFLVFLVYVQRQGDIEDAKFNNARLYSIVISYIAVVFILQPTNYSLFIERALLFIIFYGFVTISLNLSSGLTGIVNFGVVAQVAVSSVVIGILTVRGVPIIYGLLWAIFASAVFSGILALSTLRLREDYFAIVSITIGEIIKQFLQTEPSLRASYDPELQTTPGILGIPQPFHDFYEYVLLDIPFFENISYRLVLGVVGIVLLLLVYFMSNMIFYSPYGRLLKSIREDEEVTNVYGKDVFYHKVLIMVISGVVTGFAGAMLAWIFIVITPENFFPLVTFFTWTAFIIGGRGNNKGMIVGAIIFVLLDRVSRFIDSTENWFMSSLNFVVSVVNPNAPPVDIAFLQSFAIGLTLILFLRFAPRGLVAEEAFRPKVGDILLPKPGSQAESQKSSGGMK